MVKIGRKIKFISSMDSNTTLYFLVVAIEMPVIRLIVTAFDEWPAQMHLSSKMHLEQMTKELQAVAVNDFRDLFRYKSTRKTDIQSITESKRLTKMFQND